MKHKKGMNVLSRRGKCRAGMRTTLGSDPSPGSYLKEMRILKRRKTSAPRLHFSSCRKYLPTHKKARNVSSVNVNGYKIEEEIISHLLMHQFPERKGKENMNTERVQVLIVH